MSFRQTRGFQLDHEVGIRSQALEIAHGEIGGLVKCKPNDKAGLSRRVERRRIIASRWLAILLSLVGTRVLVLIFRVLSLGETISSPFKPG